MKAITKEQMVEVLQAAYGGALAGVPGVSQSVDELADEYLLKCGNPRLAAKELAKWQVAKCGTAGFVAGLPGLIAMPVAIPANIASVIYVQLRMIAAIAKMGGLDVRSDQVQAMCFACLTGNAVSDILKDAGIKVGQKGLQAAIGKIPGKVVIEINKKVGFRLITKAGSTGVINLTKLVPVAGGVIGGAFDVATTKIIAANAQSLFIDGKVPVSKKQEREASRYVEVGEPIDFGVIIE